MLDPLIAAGSDMCACDRSRLPCGMTTLDQDRMKGVGGLARIHVQIAGRELPNTSFTAATQIPALLMQEPAK